MNRSAIVAAASLVLLGGCPSVPCETASLDFELPDPGDAIVLRIAACPAGSASWMRVDLTLAASGVPSSPLTLLVDGIRIHPKGLMTWTAAEPSLKIEEGDCEAGKLITLERIDTQPGIAYEGSLEVEMSASWWDRKTCSLELAVESKE